MVWSYVFCKFAGRALNLRVPMYSAFLVGALPDFDIYFLGLGVEHHLYTHSIVVWAPLFLVAFLLFSRRSVPYLVGVGQHFLVGDFLVGTVPLLLPVAALEFGLNLGFPGRNEAFFEIGMLVVALIVAHRGGDLGAAVSVGRGNVLMSIPLVALASLTVLFANENNTPLLDYGFASGSLTLISLSHILLAGFLAFSTLQGIRGLRRRRIKNTVGIEKLKPI